MAAYLGCRLTYSAVVYVSGGMVGNSRGWSEFLVSVSGKHGPWTVVRSSIKRTRVARAHFPKAQLTLTSPCLCPLSLGLPTPIFTHLLRYSPLTLLGGQPRKPQSASRQFPSELVMAVVSQCVSGRIILGVTKSSKPKPVVSPNPTEFGRIFMFELQPWRAARLHTASRRGHAPERAVPGPFLIAQRDTGSFSDGLQNNNMLFVMSWHIFILGAGCFSYAEAPIFE